MPSEGLNATRALVYHERPVDSGFVFVSISRTLPSSSGPGRRPLKAETRVRFS